MKNKFWGWYDDENIQSNDISAEDVYKIDESMYNQCEDWHKKQVSIIEERARALWKLFISWPDNN